MMPLKCDHSRYTQQLCAKHMARLRSTPVCVCVCLPLLGDRSFVSTICLQLLCSEIFPVCENDGTSLRHLSVISSGARHIHPMHYIFYLFFLIAVVPVSRRKTRWLVRGERCSDLHASTSRTKPWKCDLSLAGCRWRMEEAAYLVLKCMNGN